MMLAVTVTYYIPHIIAHHTFAILSLITPFKDLDVLVEAFPLLFRVGPHIVFTYAQVSIQHVDL